MANLTICVSAWDEPALHLDQGPSLRVFLAIRVTTATLELKDLLGCLHDKGRSCDQSITLSNGAVVRLQRGGGTGSREALAALHQPAQPGWSGGHTSHQLAG